LEDAVAIKAELEALGVSADKTIPSGSAKTTRMSIQASAPNGVELGALAKGTTIALEYVEGKWRMQYVKDPVNWVSPDEAPVKPPQERYSDSLAIFAVENGKPTLLEVVPPNTKKRTFRYRLKQDYPMVILRIRDEAPEDNQGYAVYDVTLSRAP
jgi:hypothetical protein